MDRKGQNATNAKLLLNKQLILDLTANIINNRPMMANPHKSERRSEYNDSISDRCIINNLKNSTANAEILCKIAFDLDEQSQELLVYENTSLNDLTANLIEKLKRSCLVHDQDEYQITEDDKAVLKEEIKARIQNTMEQNIEKSLQAAKWRNKLKQIIEEKVRTPMDSLISPSSQRQTPTESKSVSYFKYNLPQNQNDTLVKQREIIERMRTLDRQINKQVKAKVDKNNNRLYDLGKQTNLLKDYLSKIHQYETKEEELSECTFHPFVKKTHLQAKQNCGDHHHTNDVFKRLYNEALEKKEKMKKIEVEIQTRQTEEYKHLNFIPQINECSKDIIRAKKDQKSNIHQNLYKDMLHKDQKRKFDPEWTFHPTICPKSEQIVKKNEQNRGNNTKLASYSSKQFFKDIDMVQHQSIQANRQGLKTEHSLSKSPISKKNMSTKKLQKYKIGRASDASIKQARNEEDTLKKIVYKPTNYCESESTLKQNIFSKKAFKKSNRNPVKQDSQNQWNCFVDSKDIKRQKIIITQQTIQTCNTEQANPFCHKKDNSSAIHADESNSRKAKPKNNRVDPFVFFEEREKEKKINSINNKQNINVVKQHKEEEKGIELQFQKRKHKIFEDIFAYLLRQSNSQSQISYEAILNSISIPTSLKHIFYPMAEQMKQLDVGLDRQQFVWSMARIFDSLTLQQRGWILAWGLKLEEPSGETMKNIR